MLVLFLTEQGLTRLIRGGYKGKEAAPEAVVQVLRQYSITQEMLQT